MVLPFFFYFFPMRNNSKQYTHIKMQVIKGAVFPSIVKGSSKITVICLVHRILCVSCN